MRADDLRISKMRQWSRFSLGLGLGISAGIALSDALIVSCVVSLVAGFSWRVFEARAREIEGRRDRWIADQLARAAQRDHLKAIGVRS